MATGRDLGVQIGTPASDVSRVLTALDRMPEPVSKADFALPTIGARQHFATNNAPPVRFQQNVV